MIHAVSRLIRPAAILAVVVLGPAHVWASGPSALFASASGVGSFAETSDDVPDDAHRLLTMGDFNRDGITDIAEVNLAAGDRSGMAYLTVSLGLKNGGFQQMASRFALGHTPMALVAGDFNQDGIPDVTVGDDDGTLMLFLGDGTGNLTRTSDIAHLHSVVSIVVGDFNHDGIPDMAVSDWHASTVVVLLGAGNGSFRSEWSFPLRLPGMTPHIVAADFNGDGIQDLAVVYDDEDGDTFDVMLGNGNGSFTYEPNRSLVRDPYSHCAP